MYIMCVCVCVCVCVCQAEVVQRIIRELEVSSTAHYVNHLIRVSPAAIASGPDRAAGCPARTPDRLVAAAWRRR